MASIEDIPDEIISQIFQIGPIQLRKKRRKCLMLVSKKWGKLADSSLGLEIFIGASPWEGWESSVDIDHVNINRIQDFGVSNCHIGELLEIDWDTRSSSNGLFGFIWNILDKVRMLLTSPPFPKFKHPHLLSKFRFSGLIRNDYFQSLITPATTYHLRHLQFNHSAIILLESKSLEKLDLENLNYLEIMADFTYLFRNLQELDVDDAMIVNNILALLQNRFPKLKACKLYIPFTSAREMEISKIIFSFLNRHGAHLRSLEICYFLMLAEDGDEGPPAPATGDDDQSLTQQGNIEIDQLVNGTLDQLQLRVAILHLDSEKLRCINHWSRLLSRQRELEYFHAVSERQIFSPSLITQLSNTLRVMKATVSIRGEQGQSTPLDCSIFSNCSKLTHFTIKGIFEEYVLMRTSPGLINSEYLPQTIQHIDLTRIPVLSSELRIILLNFNQLRHFAGKYLGRSGGMGVTVELLKEVIQTRQLEWFLLDASVNGDFPEHGLSNGNPIRPLFLISDNDYICAKLESDGYYVNASPFEELLANLRISPIHLNSETDTNTN